MPDGLELLQAGTLLGPVATNEMEKKRKITVKYFYSISDSAMMYSNSKLHHWRSLQVYRRMGSCDHMPIRVS